MDECSEPKVKSLAKSLKILSCFTIQEPVLGVTELAERIGVTKSNIHNILSTFTSMGYLDRLPDGRYTLGLKILEYAFIINQNLGYPNAVYDILVDTAGKTNEIVYFGLPYGTNVLYLYVAHPADRLGVLPYRDILGETAPFYCTGIGKAILAHMPEEEWLSHIPEERTKYQPNTVTDLDGNVIFTCQRSDLSFLSDTDDSLMTAVLWTGSEWPPVRILDRDGNPIATTVYGSAAQYGDRLVFADDASYRVTDLAGNDLLRLPRLRE